MTMLPIWRLSLKSLIENGTTRGGVHVIVVIAENEPKARVLAARCTQDHYDNGQVLEQYLDIEKTNCVGIGFALPTATEGVVAVDYDYDYDSVKYEWVK